MQLWHLLPEFSHSLLSIIIEEIGDELNIYMHALMVEGEDYLCGEGILG